MSFGLDYAQTYVLGGRPLFWFRMSVCFSKLNTLLEFGPLSWSLGYDLLVLWFGIEGPNVSPFACYFLHVLASNSLLFQLDVTIMAPRKRMVLHRGGLGYVGVTRS